MKYSGVSIALLARKRLRSGVWRGFLRTELHFDGFIRAAAIPPASMAFGCFAAARNTKFFLDHWTARLKLKPICYIYFCTFM